MPTLIHTKVEAARAGTNPTVVARVRSGWVVIGDVQVVPGYCLLLPDPVVSDLNALTADARRDYLLDMTAVGDALLAVTDAYRINYEILGNVEQALHAHVVPRYLSEPDDLRRRPIFMHDWSEAPPFDAARDAAFMEALRDHLRREGVAT